MSKNVADSKRRYDPTTDKEGLQTVGYQHNITQRLIVNYNCLKGLYRRSKETSRRIQSHL